MSADPLAPLLSLDTNVREKTADAQVALNEIAANLIGTTLSLLEIEMLECRARDLMAAKRHPRYASVVRDAFLTVKTAVEQREYQERVSRLMAARAALPAAQLDPDELELSYGSLTERTQKACAILARNEQERLYRQGGALSRLRTDGEQTEIEVLSPDALRGEMDRTIKFIGEEGARVDPPQPLVKNLYAWPDYSDFRRLRGLTSTPFIGPCGKPVTEVGYDAATAVYLANTLDFGALPDVPNEAEVSEAVALLREPFRDFPFAHEAGLTHVLALILTPIARELIQGPTPIFAVDASLPRSGKGLLVKLVGTILTGKPPAGASLPSNDEEIRKNILAKLRGGPTIVLIDNVNRAVDSGALAAVITMEEWRDRILGESKEMVVPNRCAWVMTGNNMTFSQENTGRVVWIRLIPNTEDPSGRTDFYRDEEVVQEWVREQRPQLFRAAMILMQNWLIKGRPSYSGPRLGGFAAWCSVVGGVLQAAGVQGFLGNREELAAGSTTEQGEWDDFVNGWWDVYKDRLVTTNELLRLAEATDLLDVSSNSLDGEKKAAQALGITLKRHQDTLWLLYGEAGEPERRVWLRRHEDKRGSGKRKGGQPRKGWYLECRQPQGGSDVEGLVPPTLGGAPHVPPTLDTPPQGIPTHPASMLRDPSKFLNPGSIRWGAQLGAPALTALPRPDSVEGEEEGDPLDDPVDVAAALETGQKAALQAVEARLRRSGWGAPR